MSLPNLKKKKNSFTLSFPQIHFHRLLALNSFDLKLSFRLSGFQKRRVLQRSKEHRFKLHSNTYNIIIQAFHEYYNITSLLC